MLGIEDYGSDSDSEQSLPDISTTVVSPKTTKTLRGPKKITISLPSISNTHDILEAGDERPAKKQKTGGAGSSSLLSMLPLPKQVNLVPQAQRVLGGGTGPGLKFHASTSTMNGSPSVDQEATSQDVCYVEPATLFRPTSVSKGRKNISLEETSIKPTDAIPKETTSAALGFFSLGGCSLIFYIKWENEYNAHLRALEKGTIKGFEGLRGASVEEVDAMKEMEKAKKEIKEREEKKAITQGAGGGPVAPKMNINASKTSGVARSRHQLSTLLKEAYENREALEERIAQGKRNRKEAGNKYVNRF
ncbi:hypothetical protein M413DRAFT_15276 [Hebeloma cylindrosporum]|uniref:Uncharacterized protein n=1 Tax=Hebeloma cylindrosporum TaxID=76867 RepID=A0A0C2Z7H2_HEBCY|nr:hypothetical protein M413DRAFT_15276 [Hebeloma cylindrosporum h7]